MNLVINEFVSAVLQLLFFTLIPFIFFLFRKDKSVSFVRFIGLYQAPSKSLTLAALTSLIFVAATIALAFVSEDIREMMTTPPSITGKIREMGFSLSAVLIILITALIKTSLAEEILFRGLIAKRLIAWLGFQKGNLLQSFIFGILHFMLFWFSHASVFAAVFTFALSGVGAYLIGIVNEKYASGSIIPGWVAHGLGNVLSYTLIGFVI